MNLTRLLSALSPRYFPQSHSHTVRLSSLLLALHLVSHFSITGPSAGCERTAATVPAASMVGTRAAARHGRSKRGRMPGANLEQSEG
eukprot:scaffold159369_cov32-Tisochrysis_lutea.AAC.3